MSSFNETLSHGQIVGLKVFSISTILVYGFITGATLDTMIRHKVCRKKCSQVNFNLILFYLLAIIVCIGRTISMIFLFLAVQKNDR